MQNKEVFAVLRESLIGQRPVDSKTGRSIMLLAERLEMLKKQHPVFLPVGFSTEVEQLAEKSPALLVS